MAEMYDLTALTGLRMQKIYEFGEIEFERKMLKGRLDQLDQARDVIADEIVELEQQIDNFQNSEKKSEEKLV